MVIGTASRQGTSRLLAGELRAALVVVLLLLAGNAISALSVTLDRNQVGVGETFTLTVQQDGMSGADPDLAGFAAALDEQIEIVGGPATSKHFTFNNGRSEFTRRWVLQLMARKKGAYVIPPIVVGSEKSEPQTLEVRDVAAPAASNDPIRVSAQIERRSPYPDQIIKLTFSVEIQDVSLEEGRFTLPDIAGMQAEPIGEYRSFDRRDAQGRLVKVLEQDYVLSFSTPGEVRLDPLRFEGKIREGRQRGIFDTRPLKRIIQLAAPITVNVKPIPKNFPGTQWLIANDLKLSERWQPDTDKVQQGDSTTRTITVLGTQVRQNSLPDIDLAERDRFRLYPSNAQRNEEAKNGIMHSRWERQFTYVFTDSGDITLPEVRVYWWNAQKDELASSVLPARKLNLAAAKQSIMPPPSTPATNTEAAPPSFAPWVLVMAAVVLLMNNGVWYWAWRRKAVAAASPRSTFRQDTSWSPQALLGAMGQRDARGTQNALHALCRIRYPDDTPSLYLARRLVEQQDTMHNDWQDALRALEDELFCNKPMSAEQWQTLHRIAAQQFERTTHADDLPPLYPAS